MEVPRAGSGLGDVRYEIRRELRIGSIGVRDHAARLRVPPPMGVLSFLAFLFVVVPIIELVVLIQLGQAVGLLPTLLLVLSTGVGGAILARAEGLRTFLRFQGELASGKPPNQSIMDGVSVLVGGVLLLTPGLLTDFLGFALLIPFSRRWIQRRAQARLVRMAAEGTIRVVTVGTGIPRAGHPAEAEEEAGPRLDPSKEIAVDEHS